MSDREDMYEMHRDHTRYSTPVPELDDHRHQIASVARSDRGRRGTIDTLYDQLDHEEPFNPVQEFFRRQEEAEDNESAIVDHEEVLTMPRRMMSIRPRVLSTGSRATSPPNSVKAFAEARKRERDHSMGEAPLKSIEAVDHAVDPRDDRSLHRTFSRRSARSHKSRRFTNETDAQSIKNSIHSSAAEDVCFPQQTKVDETRDKKKLYIDFDFLERFIAEDERDHTPPKNQPRPRQFLDMRSPFSMPKLNLSSTSISSKKVVDEVCDEKVGKSTTENYDGNRFSFFSSAWDSTIHAAEFGDLIMPGEDVRNLFYLPPSENDGVWWLNMSNPTEEEIRAICKAFGIHPLTMEDIEKQETREKIELFPAYYFACFRSFNILPVEDEKEAVELEPFNVYVIVFREGTLSFSFAANRHVAVVRKRITALKEYVSLSSDWICYALM